MLRFEPLVGACLLLVLGCLLGGARVAPAEAGSLLILSSKDAGPYNSAIEGFQTGLGAAEEGASAEIVVIGKDVAKGKRAVRDSVDRGDGLIFALGTAAAKLACAQKSLPVVATLALDSQQVAEAGNATGVSLAFPLDTELQWVQRVLPERKRVGVLYSPEQNQAKVDQAQQLAKQLGLELVALEVRSPKELPDALKGLAKRVDVLWGLPDRVVLTPQTAKEILLFSFRNRIPFVGVSGAWVKAGALYSLERDYTDLGAQSAELAAQILQGKAAGTIPVQAPRRVLYSLNEKTAQRMKIDLPDSLVRDAVKVYD